MSLASLLPLVGRFQGVPVLLVGDLMLDRYLWGDVSRISPEAPVPVLRVTREEVRLGGAGSVLSNVAVLGASPRFVGLVGQDPAGDAVLDLFRKLGVPTDGLVRDGSQPTTQKTRLIARTQQMLRLDHDASGAIGPELERRLLELALERLDGCAAVLVSDYGRGVLSGGLCRTLAAEARRRRIPVLADPHRDAPFDRYQGVSCVTPNRNETHRATGIRADDEPTRLQAARALIEKLGLDYATVTLDKDGIYLLRRGEAKGQLFPAKARAVYDVAGAGDMVLAVLGLSIAAGAGHEDAVRLANIAAGLEVERVGVSPITPEELETELRSDAPPVLMRKIVHKPAQVAAKVAEYRRKGQTVVFTNGCFDLLHAGHVHFLQGCRAQGDVLIVGLNTDASVRSLNKGPERPVLRLEERAAVLAGLEAVDLVVPFDEPTPIALIEAVHPDVLCKGEDYRLKPVVGRELVEGWGGRVELIPLLPGMSTTHIVERIEKGARPGNQ
jgi:D-beta-D-heptose 7-phosphate kinase / D-beta-D-heptose 1-phosphate adenosyltransferase